MFCTRCGSELREKDRFCSQCGTSVSAPHSAQASYSQAGIQPGRQLARSMYDKKIAGVCAGFAHYFDCDPTLMRVIWLILAFGTGLGFIGYIVGWIAMPKDYGAPATNVVPSGARGVQL